jgi:nitrite reductase (NO-forming)
MLKNISFAFVMFSGFLAGCQSNTPTGKEEAVLTHAPLVPPPITRKHATTVVVKIEVIEDTLRLADGVGYTFWTFGGKVPGQFIRVREGDLIEFHLRNNAKNKLPHNIDLHAATGPGGGATSSFTAPGHETQFSFKALNPGLYVYHCATAPVGMHVANGMYGLILVEPKAGLRHVDKEYYVMQSEFYTQGAYGERGVQPFDMQKALREEADYVVFNGSVGSLVGDVALTAKTGQTVRLYVGNGGPNLVSSFHVIGEIFDTVLVEGGDMANHNVQTTLIPAGGSAIVEFKVEVPGTFILVDHSIFRAFNKGALGMLKVTGPEDPTIYSGQQADFVYLPEGGAIQVVDTGVGVKEPRPTRFSDRMKVGKDLYQQNCLACHQADGKGVPNAFPPLAGSDYLLKDPNRGIRAVSKGLEGPIIVNGQLYDGLMPAVNLRDDQIASVITYVLNSWGNKGGDITEDQVVKAKNTP